MYRPCLFTLHGEEQRRKPQSQLRKEQHETPYENQRDKKRDHTLVNPTHRLSGYVLYYKHANGHRGDNDPDHDDNADGDTEPYGVEAKLEYSRVENWRGKNHECHVVDKKNRPLEDNEERYRLIVNTADEGIWVLDEQYLTTFVNRRMADMLGYSRDEMARESLSFFVFEDDFPDHEAKMAHRREGIAERFERRLRRKDGTTLWALVSATPMMDKQNHFQGSFAMYTDITERKQTENALLESEAKYRSIFENAVEGMFQSTPEGRLVMVNPAMAHILGYASPEEIISAVTNVDHQLYTNADDRHIFIHLLNEQGVADGFESQFYRKDGSALWGSLNVRTVKDPSGNVLSLRGYPGGYYRP